MMPIIAIMNAIMNAQYTKFQRVSFKEGAFLTRSCASFSIGNGAVGSTSS